MAGGSGPDISDHPGKLYGHHNLIGDGSGQSIFVDGIDGNQIGTSASPIDPMLSDWTQFDNGRWGYYLLPGSPAINAGSNNLLPADTFDLDNDGNTSEPFAIDLAGAPRVVGGVVDIGATEFVPEQFAVVGHLPRGEFLSGQTEVTLFFNRKLTTLTTEDLTLVGPYGDVPLTSVSLTRHENGWSEYLVQFDPLDKGEEYLLTVMPTVQDEQGDFLDQDLDNTPGESNDDRYLVSWSTAWPGVVDLGPIDFRLLDHLNLSAGSLYYQIEIVHDGLLSLQVDLPTPPKSARLRMYGANPVETAGLTPLAESALDSDANQRIDWTVAAGQTYYVEIYGANLDFDLRIANLVHHDGTTVTVHGTDGDDTFAFAPTGSYQVTINGVGYHFDDAEVDTVQFDGGNGHDVASLDDSSGGDTYTVTPDYALMEAPDFTVRVESVSVVHAYARNGGDDTAIFIDSPGKDKVKAEDGTTVKMFSPNRSFYNRAKFFETVQVNFSEGGAKDDARLWDSPASDIFDGTPGHVRYYSQDTAFDVTVLGADFVTVYSTNGGNDKLILHDSPGDDVFRAKSRKVEMFDRATGGDVHKITARKFKDVTAYADQGGQDIAKLYDSTLDDLWEAEYRQGETWSKMASTSRALCEVLAFEQVKGYSVNGGTNTLKKTIVPREIDFVLTHGNWEDRS